MTRSLVTLIVCERCGQAGQTTGEWSVENWGDGPKKRYNIDQPDTWKGFIKYENEVFAIGVKRIVWGHNLADYPGEPDDEVDIRIDLCPTCRMSFLTWWLEGKKS
jgi:hypothetical protein